MNYHLVEFLTSFGRLDQIPTSEKPEIVFAGRSNVGKSSLINKIFNQKSLARVSATPGKTATINFFDGGALHFADLPGYGYAKVSHNEKIRWAELIEGYLNDDRDIRLVFSLVDVRHKPSKDDIVMIDFLIDSGIPFVVVLTKCDKLSKSQLDKRVKELHIEIPCGDQITLIPCSAQTGTGITDVRDIIEQIVYEYVEECAAEKARVEAEDMEDQQAEEALASVTPMEDVEEIEGDQIEDFDEE